MYIDFILDRPKTIFLMFTILTLLISSQALDIKITSSIEVYLPKGQPTVETLNEIRDEWPIDSIIIYVDAEDVTKPSVLREMLAVEGAINWDEGEEDGVVYTASIASFIKEMSRPNFFDALGFNRSIGPGEGKIPERQEGINLYLKFIPDEMKYKFITSDHKNAIIMIMIPKDADQEELMASIHSVLDSPLIGETKMEPTSQIPMMQESIGWSYEQFGRILPISMILLIAVLFIFHRNLKVVFIIGIPLIYAIVLTFGTAGMMTKEFVPYLLTVAPLLLALGIAYTLHLVNHYMEEVDEKSPKEAIKKIIPTTGKAVLLSAITTIAGFTSLMTSHMTPISDLGLIFIIGIFYCFISTIVLVPCLILILNYRKKMAITVWEKLSKGVHHRKKIFLIAIGAIIISLIMLPSIETEVSMTDMMPEDIESGKIMTEYSEKFGGGLGGAYFVRVREGTILEPEVLKEMDEMQQMINDNVENASAYSIVDIIKQLNFGRIPEKESRIELIMNLLGEKYEQMMLNKDHTKTLVYVAMPMMTIQETETTVNEVDEILKWSPQGTKIDASMLTGMDSIMVAINNMLFREQLLSMGVAFVLVFLCLLIVFKSFRYALFTWIPLLIIISWEPGALVLFNIPLNMGTIMVSSVVIGVGIDFCVHITQRVRDELGEGKSGIEAVKTAVAKKSPSLIEATVALIAGSIPIFFIKMEMMRQFIFIILLLLSFACIVAIFVLPSAYSIKNGKWLEKWGREKEKGKKVEEEEHEEGEGIEEGDDEEDKGIEEGDDEDKEEAREEEKS